MSPARSGSSRDCADRARRCWKTNTQPPTAAKQTGQVSVRIASSVWLLVRLKVYRRLRSIESPSDAALHSDNLFRGKTMDTKLEATAADHFSRIVWCSECHLRIAPYDLRTVWNEQD